MSVIRINGNCRGKCMHYIMYIELYFYVSHRTYRSDKVKLMFSDHSPLFFQALSNKTLILIRTFPLCLNLVANTQLNV